MSVEPCWLCLGAGVVAEDDDSACRCDECRGTGRTLPRWVRRLCERDDAEWSAEVERLRRVVADLSDEAGCGFPPGVGQRRVEVSR